MEIILTANDNYPFDIKNYNERLIKYLYVERIIKGSLNDTNFILGKIYLFKLVLVSFNINKKFREYNIYFLDKNANITFCEDEFFHYFKEIKNEFLNKNLHDLLFKS